VPQLPFEHMRSSGRMAAHRLLHAVQSMVTVDHWLSGSMDPFVTATVSAMELPCLQKHFLQKLKQDHSHGKPAGKIGPPPDAIKSIAPHILPLQSAHPLLIIPFLIHYHSLIIIKLHIQLFPIRHLLHIHRFPLLKFCLIPIVIIYRSNILTIYLIITTLLLSIKHLSHIELYMLFQKVQYLPLLHILIP